MPAFTSELAESLSGEALDRFQRYVRVDTQARRERDGSPSTPGQLDLGRLLVGELEEIGVADAALDDNGYVTATLPATLSIFWNGCHRGLSITTTPSPATACDISGARSGTSWS